MPFNSLEFALFFIPVLVLYYALPHRFRWIFLLAVSYLFYASFRPKYSFLLLITTVSLYVVGIFMEGKGTRAKKLICAAGIIVNLGLLFVYKYLNFFNSIIHDLGDLTGFDYRYPVLRVALPVGISFYTLQALSYIIDVYRGNTKAERHFGYLALYVSFFPLILSGPIERSTRLLPQLYKEVRFDYETSVRGLIFIVWGLFLKMVIADRLAIFDDAVFANPYVYDSATLFMTNYFFTIQIYCDFAAYSAMAIGIARLLGFQVMDNFRQPFHSESIAELWRRWHISLSSWFRDYLYIPLGGNRKGSARRYYNILVVFILSGLWHGAQWTFIAWGTLHGIFIAIGTLTGDVRKRIKNRIFSPSSSPLTALLLMAGGVMIAAGLYHVMMITASAGSNTPALMDILLFMAGAAIIILALLKRFVPAGARLMRFSQRFVSLFITFHLFACAAVFFRAKSIKDAAHIVIGGIDPGLQFSLKSWNAFGLKTGDFFVAFFAVTLLFAMDTLENRIDLRQALKRTPILARWSMYVFFMVFILLFGIFTKSKFIYFQY